jgi:hypothetical protein
MLLHLLYLSLPHSSLSPIPSLSLIPRTTTSNTEVLWIRVHLFQVRHSLLCVWRCIQKFPNLPLGLSTASSVASATLFNGISIFRVSVVSFAAITLSVASQWLFSVVCAKYRPHLLLTQKRGINIRNTWTIAGHPTCSYQNSVPLGLPVVAEVLVKLHKLWRGQQQPVTKVNTYWNNKLSPGTFGCSFIYSSHVL